jgi:hypothetical protein
MCSAGLESFGCNGRSVHFYQLACTSLHESFPNSMVHLLFLAKGGIVCINRTLLAIVIHIKNISIFNFRTCVNQDSSVGRVMSCGWMSRVTIPGRDKRFFSTPQHLDRL